VMNKKSQAYSFRCYTWGSCPLEQRKRFRSLKFLKLALPKPKETLDLGNFN